MTNLPERSIPALKALILECLDDMKAQKVEQLEVAELCNFAETMFVCTGTSRRHVQSIAEHLVEQVKHRGFFKQGVDGLELGEWVLVDLGEVLVHVMQQEAREYYDIEKLWFTIPSTRLQPPVTEN